MFKEIDRDLITKTLDHVYLAINDRFKYDLRKDTFIAGGAIASIGQKSLVKDYDIFFTSEHALNTFKAVVKVAENKENYKETENAISFDMSIPGSIFIDRMQFIKILHGKPNDVILKFDYMHTMSYYHDKKLVILHPYHILDRKLEYNTNCSNPNGAVVRYRKFRQRGYKAHNDTAEQVLFYLDLDKPLVASYND
jgi:hypothetical protein